MGAPRERFSPSELAMVLSHYDIGVIESAKEFPRGSRASPKLMLTASKGRFLLKRRATGRDDPFRVAFAHSLVCHLRKASYPVPALIGTRDTGNSILSLEGRGYEMFEFVDGGRYDDSLEATTYSGYALARYHEAVADFRTEWTPPEGSYHDAPMVRQGLTAIPSTTAGHDSVAGQEAELLHEIQLLQSIYDEASARVSVAGLSEWKPAIVHGDWHPGNLLFRGPQVCAVLDFDAARYQPEVLDIAYGMLQFSILRTEDGPAEWPDFADESRTRRFWSGYLAGRTLSAEQRRVIPDLMVEALVGDAVLPIAVTGSFGRLPGYGVLQMVRRKAQWLLRNRPRLQTWLLE